MDMGDQERYDVCEGVVSEVLRSVRAVSNEWKVRAYRVFVIS